MSQLHTDCILYVWVCVRPRLSVSDNYVGVCGMINAGVWQQCQQWSFLCCKEGCFSFCWSSVFLLICLPIDLLFSIFLLIFYLPVDIMSSCQYSIFPLIFCLPVNLPSYWSSIFLLIFCLPSFCWSSIILMIFCQTTVKRAAHKWTVLALCFRVTTCPLRNCWCRPSKWGLTPNCRYCECVCVWGGGLWK